MKKSFQTEMDDTQQAVSQIVCLCTTIALHQEFGVGKTRLDRITDRIHDLEDQNTEVIMTPDANGRPSKAKAEAIREKAGWRGMSLPTTASRCYGHLVAAKSSNIRLLETKLQESHGRFTQRQLLTYCTMVQNGWNGCAKKATPTMSS